MQNDITGLGNIKVDDNNNLTDVNVTQGENTNINFGYAPNKTQEDMYQNTQLYKDTKAVREQALDDNLAGMPIVQEPTLKISKVDLNNTPASDGFTVRDQIMSKLHLMDEDYNYTDTYTNYIQQGGQPLPGYEYAHEELLRQEHYDQIFKQVDDGTMSYDDALMEAYGKDVMATAFGIDVTNVGYWRNKFANDDFSNPFANRYLMDQVKTACEEYHKTRQAGDFAHSQANAALTANSLIGEELSAKQIKDIFGNLGKYAEDQQLDDTKFLKQINSGTIPATARLIQIDETTYAFLHTDGKLHKLTKGEGIKFNEDGSPKEISLNNGNDVLDFVDHFNSGFMNVFTGLAKLGTFITAIDGIWNGEGYTQNLINDMMAIDAAVNDADWNILRADHVDLDGFKWEAKDIAMVIGDITGMVVGSACLAEIGGLAGTAGSSISEAAAQSSNILVQGAGKVAGTALSTAGNLARASTGWFQGIGKTATATSFTVFGQQVLTGVPARWLNTAVKATLPMALKDFQSTAQQLNAINVNSMINGGERVFSDEEVTKRAMGVAAFSWLTSTALSSTADSTFLQRWNETVGDGNLVSRLMDETKIKVQEDIVNGATNAGLKAALKSPTNYLKINSFVDFLNTLMGNEFQAAMTQTKTDKDGKVTGVSLTEYLTGYDDYNGDGTYKHVNNLFTRPEFWKDVTQTGVMQFKEYQQSKAQFFQGYNTAAADLRGIDTEVRKYFDDQISKATKSQDKENLTLVKQQYLADVANIENGDFHEARVVKALDNLANNLGDSNKLPKIIKTSIDHVVSDQKTKYYKETLDMLETSLEIHDAIRKNYYSDGLTKPHSIRELFTSMSENLKLKSMGFSKDNPDIVGSFKVNSNIYGQKTTESKLYENFLKDIDFIETSKKVDKDGIEVDYSNAVDIKTSADLNGKKNTAIRDLLKANGLSKETAIVFSMKQEAGYEGEFNARMKQNMFKTNMELLAMNPETGVVKLDDNNYAMNSLVGCYREAMTFEQMTALNAGAYYLSKEKSYENYQKGVSYILGAVFGDSYRDKSKVDTSEVLNTYLTKAIDNKLLSDVEAVDVIHSLLNSNDKSMDKARGYYRDLINKVNPDSVEFQAKTSFEKKVIYSEALNTLMDSTGKKKILNNSKFNKASNFIRGIDENGKGIVDPVVNELVQHYRETGRWSEKADELYNKVINTELNGKMVPVDRDIIGKESSDVPSGHVKKSSKYAVVSQGTSKEHDELNKHLDNKIKEANNFDKHTVEHNASGNLITLDLSFAAGEKTTKQRKMINAANNANMKDHPPFKLDYDAVNNLSQEFMARAKVAERNGSPLMVFDINNTSDLYAFTQIAQELKICDKDLSKLSKPEILKVINNLDNGWETAVKNSSGTKKYLKINEETQKILTEIRPDYKPKMEDMFVTVSGEKLNIDYTKELIGKAQFIKIPKSAKRYRTGDITLLPLGNKKAYQEMASQLFGTDQETIKQGTIAGKGLGKDVNQLVDIMSDVYETDKDLGTYAYLRTIINKTKTEPEIFTFSYYGYDKDKLIKQLQDQNIAGTDSSFYEVLPSSNKNVVRIALKQSQTENILNYLDNSKDFNLFKILPMFSKTPMTTSNYVWIHGAKDGTFTYTDADGNSISVTIPDMYNQKDEKQTSGIQKIINISGGFDEDSNIKATVLGELFKAQEGATTYEYDPFHGNKTTNPKRRAKALEAYKNNDLAALQKLADDTKDYEIRMIAKLAETENSYIDSDDDEAYKFFYQDDAIVRRLLKAKQEGEEISSSNLTLKKEIGDMYRAKIKSYINQNDDYTTSYGEGTPTVNRWNRGNDLYINPASFKKISSSEYYLDYNEQDPVSVKTFNKALDKALNSFNITTESNSFRSLFNYTDDAVVFTEDPVVRCLQGLAGNDGYIPIEDAQHWADLNDEQLNIIVEALDNKISLLQLKGIVKQANSANNAYNKFVDNEDNVPYEYRQIGNVSKASKSITADKLVTTGDDLSPIEKNLLSSNDKETYSDRYFKLGDDTIDSVNDLANQLESEDFTTAFYKNADRKIRENLDSPQTANIINMENSFVVQQHSEIAAKTIASIKQDFGVNEDIATKIAEDAYESAMNWTKNSGRSIIKVYDAEGNNILTTDVYDDEGHKLEGIDTGVSFNGKNYMEVYNALSKLKANDKANFVILDKHPLDTYDGITYQYEPLTQDNLKDLKNRYLGEAINYYVNHNKNWKGHAQEEVQNHLLYLMENEPKEFESVISYMVTTQVSNKAIKNQAIANLASMEMFRGRNAQYLFDALVPTLINTTEYNNEGIVNMIKNITSSLDSDNAREATSAAMIAFGRHKDLLSEEDMRELELQQNAMFSSVKDKWSKEKKNVSDKIFEDVVSLAKETYNSNGFWKKLNKIHETYEDVSAEDVLTLYAASCNNPEVLTYKTSGVTATQLKNKDWKDTELTITSNGERQKISLMEFMTNPKAKKVWFDLEGMIPDKDGPTARTFSNGTLRDIFQAHFTTDNEDGSTSEVTYFITHKGDEFKTIEDYVNYMKLKDNEYYRTEEGYRSAVDRYLQGDIDPNSSSVKFVTEEQFIKILNDFKDTTFIAFNGDNYDFNYINPYIRNNNNSTLDAMEFDNIIYGGDSYDRRREQDLVAKAFGSFEQKAHNAQADTNNMKEWATNMSEAYIDNYAKAKTRMLDVIDAFFKVYNVTDGQDGIISRLDDTILKYYNENNYADRFVQGMPSGAESVFITRQLNNIRNENLGYILYNLETNPDFLDFVGMSKFEDFIKTKSWNTVVDHVIDTAIRDNISPERALYKLFPSTNSEGQRLVTEEQLLELGSTPIDIDKSSEQYQELYNKIYNDPTTLISNADYELVKNLSNTQKFYYATQSVLQELGDMDEDLKKEFALDLTTMLSSTRNGLDQFNQTIKYVVNSGTANKLMNQVSDDLTRLNGELCINREGQYRKIFGATPTELATFTELIPDVKTHKLVPSKEKGVTIDSSTIVMDERRAFNMFGRDWVDYVNEDGSIYVINMRQPASQKGNSKYYKVKIVKGDKGMAWVTPMTWRLDFAGDFDGDANVNFTVKNPREMKTAAFAANNMNLGRDVQESLSSYLNKMLGTQDTPNEFSTTLAMYKDTELQNVCKEIDKLLPDMSKTDEELNGMLKEVIYKNLYRYLPDKTKVLESHEVLDSYISKMVDSMGVKSSNGHRALQISTVNNDPTSNSYKALEAISADAATIKTNIADSIYGFRKQRYMTWKKEVSKLQDMPLPKMDITPTYLTEELSKYIDNVEWTKITLENYHNTMVEVVNKYINNHDLSSDTVDYLKTLTAHRKDFIDYVTNVEDKAQAVKLLTNNLFQNLDDAIIMDTTLNKKYAEILALPKDDNYDKYINDRKNTINLVKKLSSQKPSIAGLSATASDLDLLYAHTLEQDANRKQVTEFVDDLNKIANHKAKVFVAEGSPIDNIADGVWVNPKSQVRAITGVGKLNTNKFPEEVQELIHDNYIDVSLAKTKLKEAKDLISSLNKKDKSFGSIKKQISLYTKLSKLGDTEKVQIVNNKDGVITYALTDSLVGSKILALGKGMAHEIKACSNDFDIAINASELKTTKLDRFLDLNTVENSPIVTQKIVTPFGTVTKRGRIFEVPLILAAENDRVNRAKPQKYDLMSLLALGNSFVAHGSVGSLVLSDDGDVYSNRFLSSPIEDANNSHNIVWKNQANVVIKGRALALGKVLEEENLWSDYKTAVKKDFGISTGIDNIKDFQQALTTMNGTSKQAYAAVQYLAKFLDTKGYKLDTLLDRFSNSEKAWFDRKLTEVLEPLSQGSITDYDNVSITSKSHAKRSVAPQAAFFIGGVYNPSERATSRANVMSNEYYYIPANMVYKALHGYYPKPMDVMQGTASGQLQYGQHFAGEVGDRFVPKDKKYAVLAPTDLGDSNVMNDLKQGIPNPSPDVNAIANTTGSYFRKTKDAVPEYDRSTGSFYNSLMGISKQIYGLNHGQRAGAFLRDFIFSPDIPTAELKATNNRMYSTDIILNAFHQVFSAKDGEPLLTLDTPTKEGSYGYLTGKGSDFTLSNMNFYKMKDIYSKFKNPENIDIKNATTVAKPKDNSKARQEAYDALVEAVSLSRKGTNNFTTKYDESNLKDTQFHTEFTYGKNDADMFTYDPMSSSGIRIKNTDKGDTINVSMALENSYGQSEMIEANSNELLGTLQRAVSKYDPRLFQDFVQYEFLSQCPDEDTSAYLTGWNIDRTYFETTMKKNHELLNSNPEVVKAFNDVIDNDINMTNVVSDMYGEPFGNLVVFFSPYKSTSNIQNADRKFRDNLHAALNFNEYDVVGKNKSIKSNMAFNFWDAHKTMNKELAKLIGYHQVADTLKQQHLIDNVETTNKAVEWLSSDNIDVSKLYVKPEVLQSDELLDVHDTIIDIVKLHTDVDIARITRNTNNPIENLRNIYKAVHEEANEWASKIPEEYATDYAGLKYALANNPARADEELLQKAYNSRTAELLVAQRLAELSPQIMTNITDYIASVDKQGKCFTDSLGRKYEMGSYVKPIGNSDTKWLVDNIEIAANSQSSEKWAQFIMEKAIRGELYIANKDMVDLLDKEHYTRKIPNKILGTLGKISKASAGLQMANPLKLPGRLIRFTGTDVLLGGSYSPKTFGNLSQSAKELTAAVYSKGQSVEPGSDFYEYLIREGQPINASGKVARVGVDMEVPSKVTDITDIFTKPFDVQNHIGRYAIWKTALDSFEEGEPIYGPCYYLKDQIDLITDSQGNTNTREANMNKASFIMDYVIGSPGGFPAITKKTSGLMMYMTFPMNLTRTFGAYAMSLGTLFNEGFTSENAPHWLRTIAAPSCTTLVAAYLGNLLIDYMCEKYDIDEEKEKEWKEEGVTIDPIGTILGNYPNAIYDSMNPAYQLKEMYLNPLISEYNKTFGEKLFGLVNMNILSKLNPAIKIPAEVLLQKDFWGESGKGIDQSANYTMLENGIRKMLGTVVGASIANNIIDQTKIANTSDTSFIDALGKGITKGIEGDLGNTKSWKQRTSNYYNSIDALKNYSYSKGYSYDDANYDNLMDGKWMSDHRYASKYGTVDDEDYNRVNKTLKKMITSRTDASTVYAYIADEWNKGTSEATLRKALNNNSLTRRLNSLYGAATKEDFYKTLSDSDLRALEKALRFEEEVYPLLKDFFPDASYKVSKNYKKPYYKNTSSLYKPSTYTPRPYRPTFVNYYPNSSYKKVKYNKPNASINRVQVNVSPQMGVWVKDYDEVQDLNNYKDTKRKGPVKLLDSDVSYINNPYYNNLNTYEKRKKSGK